MPFTKGQGGRPKGSKNKAPIGLGQYIREQTRDGAEIADLFAKVFRGERPENARKDPDLQDRMYAGNWLAERGFGRPKQSVDIGTTEAMAELLQLALGIKR